MRRAMTEGSARQRTCDHSKVEDLGADGIVEFYLCQRCHDVIVVQGNRQWVVGVSGDKEGLSPSTQP